MENVRLCINGIEISDDETIVTGIEIEPRLTGAFSTNWPMTIAEIALLLDYPVAQRRPPVPGLCAPSAY